MAVNPIITLAGDIADRLARGLDQDADSAHCLISTLGPLAPEDLAARLADPGDSEIAPLRELFFFPGPDLARDLEPALVEANLDAAGETALSRTLADTLPPVRIVLPSGEAFVLKMTPAEIEIWVRRLRPSRTAPAAVRQALSTRFPHVRAGSRPPRDRHPRARQLEPAAHGIQGPRAPGQGPRGKNGRRAGMFRDVPHYLDDPDVSVEDTYRHSAFIRAREHCGYKAAPACETCGAKAICDGFHGDYAAFFGFDEAQAIATDAPIADPRHYIAEQRKIVEPEDADWAL